MPFGMAIKLLIGADCGKFRKWLIPPKTLNGTLRD